MIVLEVVTFISVSLLLNTVANIYFLRRTTDLDGSITEKVAVIIPMRNEVDNVEGLIRVLKQQVKLDDVEYHLVNDNSTDDTFNRARTLITGDKRFFLHEAPPLAFGWLGKPAAMQCGLSSSDSKIVIFLDADVRLEDDAFARAITTLKKLKLEFISAYPRQIAKSWSELLIQPLLQWSWMTTVPLRIAERSSNPALCVANGQFLLVERQALTQIGGLQRIKGAVLDDIFLARALVREGFHGTVVDGSSIASCRMYFSWNQVREGYGKSLHVAFGNAIGKMLAITFFLSVGVLPLILTALGSKLGLLSLLSMLFTRVLSAKTCRGKLWPSLTHPLSMALLSYLVVRSWSHRKSVRWKGRLV